MSQLNYLQSQMQPFSNDQIDGLTLPRVEELVYQPLEPRYKRVLIIIRLIGLGVLAALFITLFFGAKSDTPGFENFQIYIVIGLLLLYLLLCAWSMTSCVKGFHNKFYALRQKDIVYKTGWLWKSTTTAPFTRVQHVSIDQGPIERQFNLSKLRIFTAGGNASDMTIPGLDPETADRLKEFIVTKSKSSVASPSIISDEEQ